MKTLTYIINRTNKIYDGKKPKKTINKLAFWKLRAELQGKSLQRGEGSLLPTH